jgi:thiamine-phosphate diphosphorylase
MSENSWFYPIVDVEACASIGLDPRAHAERCMRYAPKWIQLRAKPGPDATHLAIAMAMNALCKGAETSFVVNDRVALAIDVGATFIHLGQGDARPADASRIAPRARFGLSTHTREELALALLEAPPYVAYGPVFSTRSKLDASPAVGVEGLRHAHAMARAASIPLVAIGGIDASRLVAVRAHCEAVALISALLPAGGEPWEAPFERLGLRPS